MQNLRIVDAALAPVEEKRIKRKEYNDTVRKIESNQAEARDLVEKAASNGDSKTGRDRRRDLDSDKQVHEFRLQLLEPEVVREDARLLNEELDRAILVNVASTAAVEALRAKYRLAQEALNAADAAVIAAEREATQKSRTYILSAAIQAHRELHGDLYDPTIQQEEPAHV